MVVVLRVLERDSCRWVRVSQDEQTIMDSSSEASSTSGRLKREGCADAPGTGYTSAPSMRSRSIFSWLWVCGAREGQ